MVSILNTDLGDLYNQWGERVAFNEGYQRQKIADARTAGQEAFSLGLDRSVGRDAFIEAKNIRFDEAASFTGGVDDLGGVDDQGVVDDLGAVDDLGIADDFINGDPWGLNTGSFGMSADQVEWESLSTYDERSAFYSSRGLAAEGY